MLLDVVCRLSHVEVGASHDNVDTVAAVDHAGIAHAEWSGRAHVGHGICRPARHGAHGGIVGRAGVHGRSELLGEVLVEIAKLGAVEQGHGDGIRVVFVLGIAPEQELDAGLERCEDVLAVFVGDTDHLGVETRDLRDASVIARLADFPLSLEELVGVMGHIRLRGGAGIEEYLLRHELGGLASAKLVDVGLEDHVADCRAIHELLEVLRTEEDARNPGGPVTRVEGEVITLFAHDRAVIEKDVSQGEKRHGVAIAAGLEELEFGELLEGAFLDARDGVNAYAGTWRIVLHLDQLGT